jgi:hypothetical protein
MGRWATNQYRDARVTFTLATNCVTLMDSYCVSFEFERDSRILSSAKPQSSGEKTAAQVMRDLRSSSVDW